MYISRFSVRNFLNHQRTELELHRLNVFVGPNGAGKSAMFEALLNFSIVARGSVSQAFGDYAFSYEGTKFHGAKANQRIRFDISLRESFDSTDEMRYEMDYSQLSRRLGKAAFEIHHEKLVLCSGGKEEVLFDRADQDSSPLNCVEYITTDRGIFGAARHALLRGGTGEKAYPLVTELANQISKVGRFRLTPYKLAAASKAPEVSSETVNVPRIHFSGEDLASVLYYLQEKDDPRLELISRRLRILEPAFKCFDFTFVNADQIIFSVEFDDQRGTVPAIRLSDGLLIFIGLMVLAYNPEHLPIVLIEEPENGLTPLAIKQFYEALVELTSKDDVSRSQVLMSSHSPFVICEAWNGETREFIYRVEVIEGVARVKGFIDIVKDHHIQLSKDGQLSLKNAEQIMCGHFLGDDVLGGAAIG